MKRRGLFELEVTAAISSLVALDDGTILCSFKLNVCRFKLAWLEQGSEMER